MFHVELFYREKVFAMSDNIGNEVIENIDLFSIIPDKEQPRKDFDKEALNELAVSIANNGVIIPIIVRPIDNDKYMIIAGERRWRASIIAKQETIPAIVRDVERFTNQMQSLLENLQRDDLNPLEESHAYRKLIDEYNLSHEDLAERIGKSRSNVSNSLRLLNLPDDVQMLLRNNRISVGHAKVLLSLNDETDILYIANEIVDKKLSVRDSETLIKDFKRAKSNDDNQAVGKNDRELQQLQTQLQIIEDELSKKFATKVKVNWKSSKGSINIDFYSLEDIERLLDILDS